MKDKFNRYCAEVLGIELYSYQVACDDTPNLYIDGGSVKYNPYDDLNQMAEVMGKLMTKAMFFYGFPSREKILKLGIKKAIRDFIISTMPADQPNKQSEG